MDTVLLQYFLFVTTSIWRFHCKKMVFSDQKCLMATFDGVVLTSIFLFFHSRKTLFWLRWNFLLIKFLADKSFLFFTKLLVTFSLCFSSANFAFKVTCFMFLYHFFNFTFIISWCLVRGVLLFWQWSITDIYEILV